MIIFTLAYSGSTLTVFPSFKTAASNIMTLEVHCKFTKFQFVKTMVDLNFRSNKRLDELRRFRM